MWSRLQVMCLIVPLFCFNGCGPSEAERNRQAACERRDAAMKEYSKLIREHSRAAIQPKPDQAALSAVTKNMDAVWAKVEDLSREANSFPSPKYSTVSEVKYLAAVEELKSLQLQFDAANKQAGEAVARKSLSRLEKAEADLDRIEAAMEKLYEIRNRNAPSSLK